MATQPSARIILDSLHPETGSRVTTMEVTMHRFVLAEFNTHRAFSRNSASSRAIPVAKQLERVRTDPALPLCFPAEQKGMQGGEELDADTIDFLKRTWLGTASYVASVAEECSRRGLHKSVANRLLEPFLWHVVIVTATDWDNFWALRCNPLAQPEMRAAAEAMRDAYQGSEPQRLTYGEWHLPLVAGYDLDDIVQAFIDEIETAKRISAARCARVSYLTHDGKRDWDADLALAERLMNPGNGAPHASPFEHVCTPLTPAARQVGNLRNWRQFRHDIEEGLSR